MHDLMQKRARERAVFMQLGEREVTYQELLDGLSRTCGLFDAWGLLPGARIMIQTGDDLSAVTLFLAALLDGLVPVLITSETQPPRARGILNKVRPGLLFLDEKRRLVDSWFGAVPAVGILAPTQAKTGLLARLRRTDEGAAVSSTYPEVLSQAAPRRPRCAADPDDLAYIVFTSGTTSQPKGVQITHRNLFSHLGTLCRLFGYDPDAHIFNAMILAHADGLIQGPVLAAFCGGRVLRPGMFQLQTLEQHLNRVHSARVTHFLSVPTVYSMIERYAEHRDYFADGEVKHVISVAAKLECGLWRRFEQKFGRRIINIYGLTETVAGGLFSGPEPGMGGIGTIGQPVDMTARVVNPVTLSDAPSGEAGELWLRGDNVSPGYLDDPLENQERYHEDWLRTGDLVRRSEDGDYVILGRIKSMINCGGLLIRPEEIDEVLLMHPDVREAATVGLDDAEWGEIPVTAVITERSEAELIAHCRAHLEPLKIPRRLVQLEAIPRGDAGKPLINELRQAMAGKITTRPQGAAERSRIRDEEVLALAAATFNVSADQLTMDAGPLQITGWDSFGHLALITSCEQHFNVKLSTRAVLEIATLRQLTEALAQAA
jgi:long-chain acyl-CoA synthetase